MRIILLFIGIVVFVAGAFLAFNGFTQGSWEPLGVLWFKLAPSSLQLAEAIISRYIDPCGAIAALGCAPFLWHPVISTVLGWYAAPVFAGLGVILMLLGARGRRRR